MTAISEAQPLFDLQAVRHVYAGPTPVEALRGVDLRIYPGQYVALIGANGSGKSTLARHLNGLLQPTAGTVRVAGQTTQAANLPAIRRAVQMVFQQPDSQIIATSVDEDVAFGLENFGWPAADMPRQVQEALETVGLWEQRSRSPHMLSAGQKQRLALAGAIALRPQALVLDEATAMLDPAGRAALLETLRQLHRQGMTLVTITHEMDEAAEAGRVIVLHQGRVALDGPPREVFSQADELRRLGLGLPPLADLSLRLGLPVRLTLDDLLAALGCGPGGCEALPASDVPLAPIQPIAAPIIDIQGLHHAYLRGTPLASPSLHGVDLQVEAGAIVGLIGQTGSGKSTLMQHLNGLARPQVGRVVVDGIDWSNPALDVRAARQRVGLLFQQPEDQLFERYVGDDVAFGPRQMKLAPDEVRRRVQAAMEAVGLPFEAFKDRLTQSLSGGEQRRAALAGALALEPHVLAADEPTAGLDPRGRAQIIEIFRRIHGEGTTLLVASHRMDDILALCDTVAALRDGRVAAAGPTRQVLSRPEALARHGLPVLPLAVVAARLRQQGWPVPPDALTVAEIAAGMKVSAR